MVQSLDGHQRRLLAGVGDEGAALALAVLPEHRALLDLAVDVEHVSHVVLRELLREHADEQLAVCNTCEEE